MSPPIIIAAIIICIAALVCYAYMSQVTSNKRKQKERLTQGLNTRSRNFHYMLDNLPESPQSKELVLLVQRCLIKVYEQLSQIEPNKQQYDEQIKALVDDMAKTQKLTAQSGNKPLLGDPSKLNEVKPCLEELNKYVHHLANKGGMKPKQAAGYKVLIQRVLNTMTVDAILIHAKQAQGKGNLTLAVHHMARALSVLQKDTQDPNAQARAQTVHKDMCNITDSEEYAAQKAQAAMAPEANAPVQKEETEFWKKKQVYD